MKRDKQADLALLRRIQAAGVPTDSYGEPVLRSSDLRIEQLRDSMTNNVTDVRRGGALYQVFVRVTCHGAGPISLKDLLLSTEYDDTIQLASDPAESKSEKPYQLRNGATFERHLCINHLFSARPLRRGDCIEGFLLAESMRQVPAHFLEHCQVKALLTIVDQFANYYSTDLLLALERTQKSKRYPRADGNVRLDTKHVSLAVISDEVPTNRPGLKQNAGLLEPNEEGGVACSERNINSNRLRDRHQ